MTQNLPSSGGRYERTKTTGTLKKKEGTKAVEVQAPKPAKSKPAEAPQVNDEKDS